jgi:hypothetical protein
MKFYSQFNQDRYMFETFFKENKKGFFVDIGAHDGITGNNTKFFEEIGWSGVCVEPLPFIFEKLKKK